MKGNLISWLQKGHEQKKGIKDYKTRKWAAHICYTNMSHCNTFNHFTVLVILLC